MSRMGAVTEPESRATRDIVQTVYIRKTERNKAGELVNVEFDKFERVKDPAKESQ